MSSNNDEQSKRLDELMRMLEEEIHLRKSVEQQLLESETELKLLRGRQARQPDAVTGFGKIIVELSHEMNQPLSSIMNFCHASQRLLARQERTAQDVENLQDWAAQVSELTRRASGMIKQLRGLCPSGYDKEVVQIGQLVSDAMQSAEQAFGIASDQVEVSCAAQLPQMVVDRRQIEQVLVSLVRIAFQDHETNFDAERHLKIHAEDDASRIRVIISSESGSEESSEKSVKLSPECKLDLEMCRWAVEVHGGALQFETEGSRTVVRFELPVESSD